MKNIIKRIFLYLSLTFFRIEEIFLKQKPQFLSVGTQKELEINNLILDLLQGRLTKEVVMLRSRIYKILSETNKYIVNFSNLSVKKIGLNSWEKPISYKIIKKYKNIFNLDDYPLMMLVYNKDYPIEIDSVLSLPNEAINEYQIKGNKKIKIKYNLISKFLLENYIKFLLIQKSKSNEYLISFVFDINSIDKTHKLFIHYLERLIQQNFISKSDIFNIDNFSFLTDGDIGVLDGHYFEFKLLNLFEIKRFNGYIFITFSCVAIVFAENIYDKYKNEELEEKYEKKEKKRMFY